MEQLAGIVENIVFQNDQGSFAVFKLKPIRENSAVAVVVRTVAPLIGEQIELSGQWVEHNKFGRQFSADSYRRVAPTSTQGIERFLASGAVKGIGPAMAARLVRHFGLETLDVIEFKSHRLTEVEGIGRKKADTIYQSYMEQSEVRELMVFLETNGVSGSYAGRIFAQYSSFSISVLTENPYRLAEEVDGIGFRTADQIAMSLGVDRNHPDRLAAGVLFTLLQIAQAGHCCVPEEVLINQTGSLLLAERAEVAAIIKPLVQTEQLCTEELHGMTLFYPRYLYYAEKMVAERLLRLQAEAKGLDDNHFEGLVQEWEGSAGLTLAVNQRQAVVSSLAHGVLVLTGGPGTGKTTVVKGMLAVLERQGLRILLAAPTGRAAKRMSESAGREAVTVHRLLESTGGYEGAPRFARNEEEPLEADVVIIDEVSMMDIVLMSSLLKAVPNGCRVILVGDVDQLPAVGPGAVLKDIIRSGTIAMVRLTEVFRQAGQSMIVENAHRINRGMLPDCQKTPEFEFIELQSEGEVAAAIVDLCQQQLRQDGFDVWRDVQVLSPMHRLECGVENLNKRLQQALNPDAQLAIGSLSHIFRLGDKVMQMRNNYHKNVFNGDIGFIVELEAEKLKVAYPDHGVWYEKGELEELQLAYAMSVHKSQGSEYPVIVMPLVAGHYVMLQRNLLYTAVTRAKERVILLGSKGALNTAVSSERTKRRYSLLAERLRGEGLVL